MQYNTCKALEANRGLDTAGSTVFCPNDGVSSCLNLGRGGQQGPGKLSAFLQAITCCSHFRAAASARNCRGCHPAEQHVPPLHHATAHLQAFVEFARDVGFKGADPEALLLVKVPAASLKAVGTAKQERAAHAEGAAFSEGTAAAAQANHERVRSPCPAIRQDRKLTKSLARPVPPHASARKCSLRTSSPARCCLPTRSPRPPPSPPLRPAPCLRSSGAQQAAHRLQHRRHGRRPPQRRR
jgi:hypothetical protein